MAFHHQILHPDLHSGTDSRAPPAPRLDRSANASSSAEPALVPCTASPPPCDAKFGKVLWGLVSLNSSAQSPKTTLVDIHMGS